MAICSNMFQVSSYHTNITSIIWIPTSMVCKSEGTYMWRAELVEADDELNKKIITTRTEMRETQEILYLGGQGPRVYRTRCHCLAFPWSHNCTFRKELNF